MEGPAVKRFVWARSISRSTATSVKFSRWCGRLPKGVSVWLTMGRLRRRIRLIYADYRRGQSRMTLVRRELPPSRGARRPDRKTGRRIADTRTLQTCPHRASANASREIQPTFLSLSRAGGGTLRDVRARFPSRHGRPQEAHQLAGNRGHGDRRSFAVADEMAVAPMQPLLRPPRLPDDLIGLRLAPARQRAADRGAMAIVPGGLDEDPARVRIAGFRQRTPPVGLAGGVLARHQPQVGHELPGPAEALEVHDLGHEHHRRERADAAEAAQPPDGVPIRRRLREGRDLLVEFRLPRQRLFERKHGCLERALQRRQLEVLPADPGPMPLRPVLLRNPEPSVPIEQLQETMSPAHDIAPHGLATPHQVAGGFLRLVGHVDRGQLPRPKQADQFPGIAAIGLDALPGATRRQSWRDHLARYPARRDLAVEVVPRDARFVTGLDEPLALQSPKQTLDLRRVLRDLPRFGLRGPGVQNRDHELPLAIIERNVNGIILHARPPFACGSVPARNNPRLCNRSGRSFHMV